jgi:hypothetical protein
VEGLLEGYDAEFLGMLESPMDGIGVWTTSADMTVRNPSPNLSLSFNLDLNPCV